VNRFQPSTPRVALGITAVAMTVISFGLLIIVPATIDSGKEDVCAQTAAKVVTPAAPEVAIIPMRIDVIGVREIEVASAPVVRARAAAKLAAPAAPEVAIMPARIEVLGVRETEVASAPVTALR
jgi:hypothetical protein